MELTSFTYSRCLFTLCVCVSVCLCVFVKCAFPVPFPSQRMNMHWIQLIHLINLIEFNQIIFIFFSNLNEINVAVVPPRGVWANQMSGW